MSLFLLQLLLTWPLKVLFHGIKALFILLILFFFPAEPLTFDISSKRVKLTEADAPQAGEEENKNSAAVEEWPEPPLRVAPLVRTAVILPEGMECPDRGQRFSLSEDPDPATVRKLRWRPKDISQSFQTDGVFFS